ncbi:MAG: DNA mismatch repair endonuclease MutL, partial [Anaerolineales bacterium]
MPIEILPDEIASQIAAGEVVERPASVVKELVENAIDAGAQNIEVRTLEAGQQLINIRDDGQGIPADELQLAVTRHATSKLRSAEDLFRVNTLGFRGEALASIGSVSRMTITSRVEGADSGAQLHVEGGIVGQLERIGAPRGTEILVSDLFYNVPARRKFLKSDQTERRHIDETLTNYALAYPQIRFVLEQEGKIALQTTGNGERKEIMAAIYGFDIARQMLEVIAQEGDIGVTGLISPGSLTRSNRRAIQFFVNGRPVQDYSLTAALLQGYHTLLMTGRYPFAQVFIDMPSDRVDVNVHPTKAEVRFRDRDEVFMAIQRAIRRALLAYSPIPELRSQYQWQPGEHNFPTTWEPNRGQINPEVESADPLVSIGPQESPELPHTRMPVLRLVGQIAAAYLIAEGPDGLYLIDQHAAHERVLFERFLRQAGDQVASQRLLEPVVVELPPASSRLLEQQLSVLHQLGFAVEAFGRNSYLVRAVPNLLAGMDPAAAIRVLVEDFEEDETPLQGKLEEKVIARVCKRAAVKAGQVLSEQEQK